MSEPERELRGELRTWKLFALVVALAAAGLAVQVVRLTKLNKQTVDTLASREAALAKARAGASAVPIGTVTHDLTLMPRAGAAETLKLTPPDQPVLILIVAHDCGSCKALAPLWAAVATDAAKCGVRTVTIDRQSASPSEIGEFPPPLTAVHVPALDRTWLADAFDVPGAYLVSTEGKVAWTWTREIKPTDIPAIVDDLCATPAISGPR